MHAWVLHDCSLLQTRYPVTPRGLPNGCHGQGWTGWDHPQRGWSRRRHPSALSRVRSAGSAPYGLRGRRGAPGRHSERSCGAHGLIRHLPLHTRPRADPTRCLKCPACNISSVVHLHTSMAEPIGSTSPHTVRVGSSVEFRADIAMEAVPMIVDHGPVPSWLRQRARSPPFLVWWWLVGLAPEKKFERAGLVGPFSQALV